MNRKATRDEFKTPAEKCALDIIDFLIKHRIWVDTFIYVNGKRYGCWDGKNYHYNNTWDCVFVEDNKNPKDYFEYVGDFLSMSFEGGLYDILNYGFERPMYYKLEQEFDNIIKKHGKFYELGDAWNLSLYDL